MFPGAGSQHVGMGRELYETEPVYRAAVDECAGQLLPLLSEDIRDVLYPSEAGRAEAERKIAGPDLRLRFAVRDGIRAGPALDALGRAARGASGTVSGSTWPPSSRACSP